MKIILSISPGVSKNLFFLVYLICSFNSFGSGFVNQKVASLNNDTSIRVKKITCYEKWFRGKIDNTYEITVYLKFFKYSGASSGVYAVKGYYFYDKTKKNIPLVGMYDGEMTLYQFNSNRRKTFLRILSRGLQIKISGTNWRSIKIYRDSLKNLE